MANFCELGKGGMAIEAGQFEQHGLESIAFHIKLLYFRESQHFLPPLLQQIVTLLLFQFQDGEYEAHMHYNYLLDQKATSIKMNCDVRQNFKYNCHALTFVWMNDFLRIPSMFPTCLIPRLSKVLCSLITLDQMRSRHNTIRNMCCCCFCKSL